MLRLKFSERSRRVCRYSAWTLRTAASGRNHAANSASVGGAAVAATAVSAARSRLRGHNNSNAMILI